MPSKYHMEALTPEQMGRMTLDIFQNKRTLTSKGQEPKEKEKKLRGLSEAANQLNRNIERFAQCIRKDNTIYEVTMPKEKKTEEKNIKYCPMVKVGNWQEQRDVSEEDLNRFLRLRARNQLMVQKTREIIGQNLRPVNVPPKKFVRFGENIQLIARHAKTFKERGKQEGLSLSSVLTGQPTAEMCQAIIEGTILSASPLIAPCVRNVFELLPWDDKSDPSKDERLKYGQEFVLKYTGSKSLPYYVSVHPNRIIPSGNSSRHPDVFLHSRRCWANVWRAYHGDPKMRENNIGQPIPGGQDIIVTSASTNRSLCCETEYWFTTFYGLECEATAFTYYTIYGNESPINLWYFN